MLADSVDPNQIAGSRLIMVYCQSFFKCSMCPGVQEISIFHPLDLNC